MPLDATRLKTALKARYDALTGSGAQPSMDACMQALAEEVIAEFKNNAVVSSSVAVTSVSAVTPGTGVSGSGAGTASGTIT